MSRYLLVILIALSLYVTVRPQKLADSSWVYEVAEEKLIDLTETSHWGHDMSSGCTWECRASSYRERYAGKYSWLGENLYRGQSCSVDNAVELWRKSPSHNENLEHYADTEVLLIERSEKDGQCYMVQIRIQL